MDNLVTSNIRQRPIRTLVSVAGIALGVSLVMLFTGLARGMSNDLQRRASNVRAELIFMRPGAIQATGAAQNLDVRYADRLKAIDGVEDAIAVGRHFFQGATGIGIEQIDGVDFNAYARMNGIQFIAGQAPSTNGEAVIDEVKARNNNLHVGDVIHPFGNSGYRIVGIYSPESGPRVKLTLAGLQEALESSGKCTFIFVKLRNPDQLNAMATRINQELPGNTIQPTREVFAGFEKSIPYLGIFLRVLVGLAAVVSALVVMLAMYTTITERTREIGILKAMGASRGYIVGIIEKEAVLISIIGLIVGFAVSWVAGYFIHKTYGLVFEYSWQWALTAAVIGLVGGILGALYPAVRASNLDPVNALAYD
ncbi:MAG TPA: FtsX-like permease family protein [Pyrinomonadaceae bacterium]|nr:FtsX-like permease family protein [Pyrinomonadaceae bacterium]